jgi:hypothetical protein
MSGRAGSDGKGDFWPVVCRVRTCERVPIAVSSKRVNPMPSGVWGLEPATQGCCQPCCHFAIELVRWLTGFGEVVKVGVRGTGSYGAGAARLSPSVT